MGSLRLVAGVALLAMEALAASGCLANRCLLSDCEGPGCHCAISTCGEGAAWDDRIQSCRCLPGRALVGGQCLGPAMATAASPCAPGEHLENGACYATTCRPGDELDRATGTCIPAPRVAPVASTTGVDADAGPKLTCPPGQKLVTTMAGPLGSASEADRNRAPSAEAEGPHAACVPIALTCASDEAYDGHACVKLATSCPEGSTWSEAEARCVPVAKKPPPEEAAVDVASWALASFGPDGGNGTARFCDAFAKKPWVFGVKPGSSALLRVAVNLRFPDGAIAKGTVTTAASFATSGAAVFPRGAAEVLAAARALAAPLLDEGGHASSTNVTTLVKCTVVNASRPIAVPATGGL